MSMLPSAPCVWRTVYCVFMYALCALVSSYQTVALSLTRLVYVRRAKIVVVSSSRRPGSSSRFFP